MGVFYKSLLLDPSDQRWLDLLMAEPHATIFHHPAWINLISKCYGFRAFVIAVKDDIGRVSGGLPVMEVGNVITGKRFVSLPFTDYCPPLARDDEILECLEEAILEKYQLLGKSHEIRWEMRAHHLVHQSELNVLHSLKLMPNQEEIFKGFSNKFRQYPRKAQRNGLHVISTDSLQDISKFYALHLKSRVKLGVPIQPKRWFDLLWYQLISSGLGHIIIVASGEGIPISGAVILKYREKAMIKYSASDPTKLSTRCHYYLFWKCIEWACQQGCSIIDFGKSDLLDNGLRKFKSGWGAEEKRLIYSTVSNVLPSRRPDRLTRVVRSAIRNAPPIACRVLGELLYGHFA